MSAKNKTTLFALPANVSLLTLGKDVTKGAAPSVNNVPYDNGRLEELDEASTEYTIMVMIIGVGGYIFLVITLMAWCSYCRSKRKAEIARMIQPVNNMPGPNPMSHLGHGGLEMNEQNSISMSYLDQRKLHSNESHLQSQTLPFRSEGECQSQTSSTQGSKRSKCSIERLQYPRNELQTMMLLGNGEFGEVVLSKAICLGRDSETIVLVKSLVNRDEGVRLDFKREMDMFDKVNHERVSKLLAICREQEPVLMVLEYTDWGDLKQFLLATRSSNCRPGQPKPTPLNLPQILGLCHQISLGMEHITNHRFIHKDLATRNCLINSRLEIKISSSSLSKDTYSADYITYRSRDVPMRWSPNEAVFEDEWSAKSDVWSFAVTAWEIFHQAELPFPDKDDEEVERLLQQQLLTLEPPSTAPSPVLELLALCWDPNPKARPNFGEIAHTLSQTLLR